MAELEGIYKKIFNVQAEVGRLKKDKQNPHFKNSYVDVNSVLDELMPLLHKEKLLLIQPTGEKNGVNCLYTKLVSIDDGAEVEEVMLLPNGLDAQKTGSALTYYRRYMLVTLFGLQTVDDDGKAGSNPIKEKKKASVEMIAELELLLTNNQSLRTDWLNFIGVVKFEDAPEKSIQNAINQIKGGK